MSRWWRRCDPAPDSDVQCAGSHWCRDEDRAKSLNRRLSFLYDALAVESNPIPVKWMLCRMGAIGGGIGLPLTWLQEEHVPTLVRCLQSLGLTKEPQGSYEKKY